MEHKIQSIIVIDVETGGLDCTKNPICSVALSSFNLNKGEKISTYNTYVQPYGNLEYQDAAMKFTGIKFTDLQAGKPIKAMVEELCEQFKLANTANTHTKKPVFAGHNIGFDIGFIVYAFNFCKVDISKFIHCNKDGFGNQYPVGIDTMWLGRMKWGEDETMTHYKLSDCCNKANVALTDAHDAINDVSATEELLKSYMNNLRSGGDSGEQKIKHRPREHFQF